MAQPQFQATGLLAGRCYRWQVIATGADVTATASATSGSVWVLPTWTGRLNLYRPGIFSTQATYSYCVPASAQMALNIARGRQVHSASEQAAFYRFGRAHDLYRYSAPGLDPAGAIAVLRIAGNEPSYHEVRARLFASMLKIAVQRMRLTGRPVILFVGNGSHAWLLNGFQATADPAATSAFIVTNVWVSGPLWPKERRRMGWWDLPPNTRLTTPMLRAVHGAYIERTRMTRWTGWYVAVAP